MALLLAGRWSCSHAGARRLSAGVVLGPAAFTTPAFWALCQGTERVSLCFSQPLIAEPYCTGNASYRALAFCPRRFQPTSVALSVWGRDPALFASMLEDLQRRIPGVGPESVLLSVMSARADPLETRELCHVARNQGFQVCANVVDGKADEDATVEYEMEFRRTAAQRRLDSGEGVLCTRTEAEAEAAVDVRDPFAFLVDLGRELGPSSSPGIAELVEMYVAACEEHFTRPSAMRSVVGALLSTALRLRPFEQENLHHARRPADFVALADRCLSAPGLGPPPHPSGHGTAASVDAIDREWVQPSPREVFRIDCRRLRVWRDRHLDTVPKPPRARPAGGGDLWSTSHPVLPHRALKMPPETACTVRVAVDLSFDAHMSERETRRLATQLGRMYSDYLRAKEESCISLCSFQPESSTGKALRRFQCGSETYLWDKRGEHFSERFAPAEVVVLSPDAAESLLSVEPDKVYILGGLVDHCEQKNVTQGAALRRGLTSRRLPLPEALGPRVRNLPLSLNQVYRALLAFAECGDWTVTLALVLPPRLRPHTTQKESPSKAHS